VKRAPVRHRVEYAFYLGLKGFLRALPHQAARGFGRGLGALAHRVDRRHREVALANLALALPELSETERRLLVAECFRHFGGALCDTVSSSRFDVQELCHRLTYEGWEHLEEAAAAGKGVFVLSAHLGHWEIAALPIGIAKGSLHVVVRPADNPWLDRELTHLRERFGNRVTAKQGAARKMIQVLRERGWAGILIDQRVQPREAIAVPFFGRPALTTPVLARLSLRTGAPVVAIFAFPEPGGRYRFVAREPIFPESPGSDPEDAVARLTERYLALTEEEIRKRPAQWLWMHRRWEEVRGRGKGAG
jgi:Kdo2-lipid IVA lauroyltransferase/acyltransferase